MNGTTITHFNGNEIDLSKWQKLCMREAIIKFWPNECECAPIDDFALHRAASRARLRAQLMTSIGKSGTFETA